MKDVLIEIVLFVLKILLEAILFVLPTMLLWNWLMPVLFGLPKITFLQSLGILFLSGFLFGDKTAKPKDEEEII